MEIVRKTLTVQLPINSNCASIVQVPVPIKDVSAQDGFSVENLRTTNGAIMWQNYNTIECYMRDQRAAGQAYVEIPFFINAGKINMFQNAAEPLNPSWQQTLAATTPNWSPFFTWNTTARRWIHKTTLSPLTIKYKVPATYPAQADYIFRTLFGLPPHSTGVPDGNNFLVWTFPVTPTTSSGRQLATYTEPTPWDMYSLNNFSMGFEGANYDQVFAAVQGCTGANALNSIPNVYSRLLPFNLSDNEQTQTEYFPLPAKQTGIDIKYVKFELRNSILDLLHVLNGAVGVQFDIVYQRPIPAV